MRTLYKISICHSRTIRITNVKYLSWGKTVMLFHIPVSAGRSIYRSLDCGSCSVSNKFARSNPPFIDARSATLPPRKWMGRGTDIRFIKIGNTANFNSKAGRSRPSVSPNALSRKVLPDMNEIWYSTI